MAAYGYTKVKQIGKGSFGTVWLVSSGGTQLVMKEVHLKGLPPKEMTAARNEVKVIRARACRTDA